MRVRATDGIVGVTSVCTIRNWADARLLQAVVRECFTVVVLTIPYCLRSTVLESYHVVLPVAYMIPNWVGVERIVQNGQERPIIKSIEIHVKDVDEARVVR